MKCTINDIAVVISESIPNPAESGYDIFVGLEHYDSGEVKVTRYGSTENLVTAVKVFKKGDILLARRNVYLKRAGLVVFDGVTSGDSIVLRVKQDLSNLGISSAAVQKYLPFVLNTEEFWNYAEKYSDGTMSKRLSPKTLLQYEFEIPEDVESKNELLWAAFDAKESYRAMIRATDEMVKSQFIARFGTTECSPFPVKFLREISLSSGEYGANTPATKYNPEVGRYIRITDIDEFGNLNNDIVSPEVAENKYLLQKGDLLYARTGATVGKTYLHKEGKALYAGYLIKYRFTDAVLPDFVFAYTHSQEYYQWVELTQKVGAQPNISAKQYDGLKIIVPPIEEQKSFVALMHQADKSKFELKKAIEKIDKVMRALMQ